MVQCVNNTGWVYGSQVIPLKPNVAYTFSGRYFTTTPTSGSGSHLIKAVELAADGTVLATNSFTATSTSWAQFTIPYTTNVATAAVRLEARVDGLVSTLYVDHMHHAPTSRGVFG